MLSAGIRLRRPGLWLGAVLLALLLAQGGVAQDTAAPPAPVIPTGPPEWKPLFKGIERAEVACGEPASLRVHAVRIDLHAPGIRFLVTPSNGDRPLETDSAKTSTFLVKHGCQLAVNASPFSPVEEEEGAAQDILGLSVSDGDAYSGQHPTFGSLIITRDNKARIAVPPLDAAAAHNAVGGFHLLLDDGENVGTGGDRHPRTAAGVSEDGRLLYLLVIDGRQPGYSIGATTAEAAEWLKYFGAHSGLNLDGGGSTALVISDGKGGFRLLNQPIHNGFPGLERAVGNHLGVFAEPLHAE